MDGSDAQCSSSIVMSAAARGFTWKITGVSISATYVKVHPIRMRLCGIVPLSLPRVSVRLPLPASAPSPATSSANGPPAVISPWRAVSRLAVRQLSAGVVGSACPVEQYRRLIADHPCVVAGWDAADLARFGVHRRPVGKLDPQPSGDLVADMR